jgi:hypothetical protein
VIPVAYVGEAAQGLKGRGGRAHRCLLGHLAMTSRRIIVIIYRIRLPRERDAKSFATFMRDEYFPAIHKGSTRIGQVTSLTLESRDDTQDGSEHEFFLRIGWSGLPTVHLSFDDDGGIERRFTAFGAVLLYLGTYEKIVTWKLEG